MEMLEIYCIHGGNVDNGSREGIYVKFYDICVDSAKYLYDLFNTSKLMLE